MTDYIGKNEALNLIMHNDKVYHYADERYENVVYETACKISDVVANMPAVDVQPVKHGRCVIDNEGYERCSVCNEHETGMRYFTFCPRCGARMDGDNDDN